MAELIRSIFFRLWIVSFSPVMAHSWIAPPFHWTTSLTHHPSFFSSEGQSNLFIFYVCPSGQSLSSVSRSWVNSTRRYLGRFPAVFEPRQPLKPRENQETPKPENLWIPLKGQATVTYETCKNLKNLWNYDYTADKTTAFIPFLWTILLTTILTNS